MAAIQASSNSAQFSRSPRAAMRRGSNRWLGGGGCKDIGWDISPGRSAYQGNFTVLWKFFAMGGKGRKEEDSSFCEQKEAKKLYPFASWRNSRFDVKKKVWILRFAQDDGWWWLEGGANG